MTEEEKFVRCFAAYLMSGPAKIIAESKGQNMRLMVDFQYRIGRDKRPTINILQSMLSPSEIDTSWGDMGDFVDDE